MEIHKGLVTGTDFPHPEEGPDKYWDHALFFVKNEYPEEINRVKSVDFHKITPDIFFKEYVWVVHATGFSAKSVSKFIDRLIASYGDFKVLASEDGKVVEDRVRKICNNPLKIKSIHETATILSNSIEEFGWENYRDNRLNSAEKLVVFPYVGKITCYHLARNIGLLDSVKPDLHLVRLSEFWGFESCDSMCGYFSEKSGFQPGIVDLVLWYAASSFGTLSIKGKR